VATFRAPDVEASGRNVGRTVYWKLYAMENIMRVLIHSVLTAQVGSDWWAKCVDQGLRDRAAQFRSRHASSPWHGAPGTHDIYYLGLPDLNRILRANAPLVRPGIGDADQWIARIEQIRLPRNVVACMNWPGRDDGRRIDVFHRDACSLAAQVAGRVPLVVPA
jgi:hypothetical protein